ncbi:hypothetical protein G7Z17_g5378 [Cylindrodendrum hubeiense]|uniref:GPI anchored cell wall protein n=1 Tax=Cylindrodendrum hubeiense TaxID=595255 RepID=A0A9P5HF15_9HYPO|nr:hypothetical protein G7Z17_g5378 [Cylindrodendrum hubeiense]
MTRSLFLLALYSGAAAAAAAKTTVKVDFIGYNQEGVQASIVDVDSAATTFALSCPESASCYVPGGSMNFTYGPSTMAYTFVDDESHITNSLSCKLTPSKDVADCTGVVESKASGTVRTSAIKTTASGYTATAINVTITAGATKLSANAAETTGSDATASTVATAAATGSSSTASNTDNGGGPVATQNVVLAGFVAAVGGAVMLL